MTRTKRPGSLYAAPAVEVTKRDDNRSDTCDQKCAYIIAYQLQKCDTEAGQQTSLYIDMPSKLGSGQLVAILQSLRRIATASQFILIYCSEFCLSAGLTPHQKRGLESSSVGTPPFCRGRLPNSKFPHSWLWRKPCF